MTLKPHHPGYFKILHPEAMLRLYLKNSNRKGRRGKTKAYRIYSNNSQKNLLMIGNILGLRLQCLKFNVKKWSNSKRDKDASVPKLVVLNSTANALTRVLFVEKNVYAQAAIIIQEINMRLCKLKKWPTLDTLATSKESSHLFQLKNAPARNRTASKNTANAITPVKNALHNVNAMTVITEI